MLTRGDDHFVSLDRRVGIAVAGGAALLISVYADSSPNLRARDASVYVRTAQPFGPEVVWLPTHRGRSRAIAHALSEPPRPRSRAPLTCN